MNAAASTSVRVYSYIIHANIYIVFLSYTAHDATIIYNIEISSIRQNMYTLFQATLDTIYQRLPSIYIHVPDGKLADEKFLPD